MQVDHIGYAVKKMDKAIADFEKLGYVFYKIIDDEDRNLHMAFGENQGYCVELLAPMAGKESPVDEYLKKNGPIPYHICYRSSNFDEDIKKLEQERYKIVVPPQKACAFDGNRVVFMMKLSVGLIEIVEVTES